MAVMCGCSFVWRQSCNAPGEGFLTYGTLSNPHYLPIQPGGGEVGDAIDRCIKRVEREWKKWEMDELYAVRINMHSCYSAGSFSQMNDLHFLTWLIPCPSPSRLWLDTWMCLHLEEKTL